METEPSMKSTAGLTQNLIRLKLLAHNRIKEFRTRAGFALLTCISLSCLANVTSFTQRELAALPKYCADSRYNDPTFDTNSAKFRYWAARMGPTFNDVHHYCAGLVELARGKAMPKGDSNRRNTLGTAISQFAYMQRAIDRTKQPAPLLPEILIKRGEAAALIDSWDDAYISYSEAWKLKPDYWPAYLGWAEVLLSVGKREEAKALALEGLRHSPKSEQLMNFFYKAGGTNKDLPPQREEPPSRDITETGDREHQSSGSSKD